MELGDARRIVALHRPGLLRWRIARFSRRLDRRRCRFCGQPVPCDLYLIAQRIIDIHDKHT